jgi:hypothetical protein
VIAILSSPPPPSFSGVLCFSKLAWPLEPKHKGQQKEKQLHQKNCLRKTKTKILNVRQKGQQGAQTLNKMEINLRPLPLYVYHPEPRSLAGSAILLHLFADCVQSDYCCYNGKEIPA